MPEFDANKYFADRFGNLTAEKAQSIDGAMQEKLKGLREYQDAAMQGRALRNPDRSVVDVLGDVGVTALNSAMGLPAAAVGLADLPTGGAVGQFLEENVGFRPGDAKKITDSWLSDAQKEADLKVQLADGFMGTLNEALDNPSVIAKSVGESVGQMLGGAAAARGILGIGAKVVGGAAGGVGPALPGVLARTVGTEAAPLVAGALGEGLMGAGSAANQLREESKTGSLTLKDSLSALGSGAVTAAMGLAGGKLAHMAKLPDVDTMLASGQLVKSPVGFAKAVIGSGVSEGVFEEMPQSMQEQMWQNYAQGKPLLTEVGDAGAMGLLSGAAMGHQAGATSALGGMLSGESKAPVKEVSDAQKAAIDTGNVDELANPKAKTYAPDLAIAALTGHSQKETTTQEERLANLAKGQDIVDHLEAWRDVLAENVANAEAGDKNLPGMKKELAKREAQLAESRKALQDLDMTAQTPEFMDAQIKLADSPVEEGNQEQADATQRVLAMAALTPDRLDVVQAQNLANNMDNGLTEDQRTFLRTFSEARQAANALRGPDDVSNEIYDGSPENMGIATYRERITRALARGDMRGAERSMVGLDKFAQGHQDKATKAKQALDLFKADGQNRRIENTNTGWVVQSGFFPSEKARKENGGFNIGSGAAKTVAQFGAEAKALTAAAAEMQAAKALKFNNASGATNVSHVPQQGSGTQSQPQADEAPSVASSGERTAELPAAEPATASGGSADVVEAAGVSGSGVSDSTVKTDSTQSTDQLQSTESTQNTEKHQSTEDTTVEPAAPVFESGKSSALQKKSPEGAAYKQRELLADFFTQAEGKDTDATKRPLVAVKNFLSALTQDAKLLSQFVSNGVQGEHQLRAVRAFQALTNEWAPKIKASLSAKANADFRREDLTQFLLVDADGSIDLEENVKTAISYGAFAYVAEQATRSTYNTDEEINLILGRDEDHDVSDREQDLLAGVGTRQNVVINALGRKVVQALGFKAKADAPMDLMPRLESALGAHALKLLLDEGILVRTQLSGSIMASLTGSSETDQNAKFQFISVAKASDGTLGKGVDSIYQANKGSSNVLDKLFGVEPGIKAPSHEPIPFMQKKTKGTGQNVPTVLAEAVTKENAVASYVRQDMLQLLGALSEDTMLEIAGAEHLEGKHISKRKGIEAKNDALKREIANFKDFVGEMFTDGKPDLTLPLFFEHSVWMQQRVGISTNLINPQSSKVHRHMLYRGAWETAVKMDDTENFMLRVGEGLGVKTDKQGNTASLAATQAKVASPVIQAGVRALVALVMDKDNTSMSEEDQAAVKAAVEEGGEAMHSLDALMALAHMEVAKAAGKTAFKTHLMGEVDGVTNGPMFSHLLMGAAATAKDLFGVLNRGGFFEKGNTQSQYNLWREVAGHLDLYENTALHMTQALEFVQGPLMDSIYQITGTLAKDGKVLKDGRNIIKTPLTAMVFGSSVGKAVDSMSDKFVGSVYDRIEKVKEAEVGALIGHINHILSEGRAAPIPSNLTKAQLLEHKLSDAQINALKTMFKKTVGKAVTKTMKQDFAVFIQRRKSFNETAQLTFNLYQAAYSTLRDQFLQEQMDAYAADEKTGIVWTSHKDKKTGEQVRVPMHDLTAAQEVELRKRVRKLTPVMHTAMSKESGSLATGLYIAKTKVTLSDRPTHEGVVGFGTKFPDGAKSVSTRGYTTEAINPGVAMLPVSIHSTDSATMHRSLGDEEALNVHDAKGVGVGGFQKAAKSLNASTWNTLLNYSPATELVNAMLRTVMGVADLIKTDALPKEAAAKMLADIGSIDEIRTKVNEAIQMAAQADTIKFEAMSQMQAVDQYALEGGNYMVTEDDRAQAAEMLAGVRTALSAEESAALDTIAQFLGEETASASEATSTVEADNGVGDVLDEMSNALGAQLLDQVSTDRSLPSALRDKALDVLDSLLAGSKTVREAMGKTLNDIDASALVQAMVSRLKPADSFWGTLGTPQIGSDPELVAFFEKTPKPKAQAVLKMLHDKLAAQSSSIQRDFNLELVKKLYWAVPADLPIYYVTPDTPNELAGHDVPANARGWYTLGGGGRVFILSPDFATSGITAELLIHELVHGALVTAVRKPSVHTKPFVDELKALHRAALEFVDGKDLMQTYAPALVSVDEFIAWGLSNRGFQRDVLSKITMESKTKDESIMDGLKAFIQNVTNILFRGSSKTEQERQSNGMTVLVSNVSALLQEVADQAFITNTGPNEVLAMAAAVRNFSTLDIHQALNDGRVSPAFQDHLAELLGSIVHKLHGPFGSFKAALMKNQAGSAFGVWVKALTTGVAPFASQVLGQFPVSPQEAFSIEQVEATMRAALDGNEAHTKMVYRELTYLFEEARERLSARDFHTGDWNTASQAEKDSAQEKYNFIFQVRTGANGRSDYLSRFAALGLGSEAVNKLLQFDTAILTRATPTTVAEKLQNLFERALQFFREGFTKTFAGQRADVKLEKLVSQLVDIEAKRKYLLEKKATQKNYAAPVEKVVKDAFASVRKKAVQASSVPYLRNHSSGVVRGAATVVRTIADEKVGEFLDHLGNLRDRNHADKPGVMAGLLNDVRGPKALMDALTLRKRNNDRLRMDAVSSASKSALSLFKDGESMAKETKAAISAVFMRTGAHVLFDSLGLTGLANVLGSKAALQQEIAATEAKLGNSKFRFYFMSQANVLGHYKATGKVSGRHMMMNAHNIVSMFGTPYEGQLTAAEAKAMTPVVEQLVALYALDYSKDVHVKAAHQALLVENQRADGQNGVEFVLRLHKKLEQDSLERLFGGNPTLMAHGYTPEVYNPNITVTVANETDGEELVKQGYVRGTKLVQDPADPDTSVRHLYVVQDGGMPPFLSGAMSMTGMHAKGTKKHSGYTGLNSVEGIANAQLQAEIANDPGRRADLANMFRTQARADLSKAKSGFLAPVLNDKGGLTNWRYLMNEDTKDAVLERENRFDKLLGALAGSVMDKQTSVEQNRTVLQALKDMHDQEKSTNPHSFIEVGPNSTDPEMREIWAMLPERTKMDVKAIWKTNYVKVRKDSLDLVFGYHKLSLADSFRKDPSLLKGIEKFMVEYTKLLMTIYAKASLGKSQADAEAWAEGAAIRVANAERLWQEVVREAKDIIVVKSGVVMMGNVWSNLWLLGLSGVPLKDIVHHHLVAMKASTAYLKDSDELNRLKELRDIGYTGVGSDLASQIAKLEDSISRNPVNELIEAGLMSTIAEDVVLEDDPYSYKGLLARKTQPLVDKLHPAAVDAVRTAYLAHDTKLYQAMSRVTQLSDFVARYTLYQHLISRQDNPLDKATAIHEASEAFVNYDTPMHRMIQYTDDMGITMFTKYALRIQRVIQKMAKDNPARVLGTVLLSNFLDLGPTVLDGSFVHKVGDNPLNMGPMELFRAVDELATVNGALSLLK